MNKFLYLALLAGCTDSVSYVAGFSPPAPQAGYDRLVAPPVLDVQPGDNDNLCQWLADPSDSDRQVVDMEGYQSQGGHHFTLYATSIHEKVGTSRICTTDDMLSVNFVGAIGGEGNGSNVVKLPDGLAFDLPAGMSIMANAHYINATDSEFDAQSVVDIKYGDPAHPLPPVGFVAVNWDGFSIPPNSTYTSDAYCTSTDKLSFFMWGNHMHEYGSSELSELIHPDSTTEMMAMDMGWSSEQTFNTPWVKWDPSAPFIVNPGDVFHLQCTWTNTTDQAVIFPAEMCVGSGFVLEAMPQAVCGASAAPTARPL